MWISKKSFIQFAVILLLMCGLSGCKEDKPAKPVHSLGLTAQQFIDNLYTLQTPFVIKNISAEKKEDGLLYFSHQFNSNIMLGGAINEKDQSLNKITMALSPGVGEGIQGFKEVLDVPVAISVVAQALNPMIDKQEIGGKIIEMTGKAASEPGKTQFFVWNNNAYSVTFSPKHGAYAFTVHTVSELQSLSNKPNT